MWTDHSRQGAPGHPRVKAGDRIDMDSGDLGKQKEDVGNTLGDDFVSEVVSIRLWIPEFITEKRLF